MIDAMQHPRIQAIAAKFAILKPLLDERARRLWAAVEARALGRGGISQVGRDRSAARTTVGGEFPARALSIREVGS